MLSQSAASLHPAEVHALRRGPATPARPRSSPPSPRSQRRPASRVGAPASTSPVRRVWEAAYLEGLRLRGVRRTAADFAGVSRRTTERHERRDAAFAAKVAKAIDDYHHDESEARLGNVRLLLRRRTA